ncbi:GMC family oxidoreductase [Natrinema saccharevitans]|uniref:GMC family oxidoreductase n=1 Tax=Natrinema saccharevitans TaxID=301967 RepID=UPI001FE6C249|nr:GMC family oxidoreductase N-terminal domain-containing protein [Natrinema saccharevitans]
MADIRSPNELSEAYLEAGRAVGLSHNEDFNAGEQAGVGFYQVTQRDGRRHSAADAYPNPVLDRPNLTAVTGARVTRIRFDGDGSPATVDASEEEIVSAGAIDSSQLLTLSGVDPADHLERHDVDVVADRPGVGRNLQVGVNYECENPISLADADSLVNLATFFLLKRGPLTSNVAEAGGFATVTADADRPEIQFHFAPS